MGLGAPASGRCAGEALDPNPAGTPGGWSARLQILACAAWVFLMLLSGRVPAASDSPPEPSALAGLTVVPPGPVTDRVRVEVRAALRNTSRAGRTFEVTFFCRAGGSRRVIGRQKVAVAPGEPALARAWWPTKGHAGECRLEVRVTTGGRVAGEEVWPLRVVPCDTPALPLLQAGWLDLLGLSNGIYPRTYQAGEADLRAAIDGMSHIGMRVAVVTYVEYQGRFFYPSGIRFFDRDVGRDAEGTWFPFDAVEAVLDQADRNGMRVFLGLGRGGDTQLLWEGLRDPARLRAAADLSARVARELWQRYGHHGSLYGWYLTHEADDLPAASAYYDAVADACHALAPDKPVMIAPSGSPVFEDDALRKSCVDIFAYQDAVGAGYRPGEYTYNPEARLAVLDGVFARYREQHRGADKHLWADLEIWEMAGPDYANPYPASFERVRRQIAVGARHVEMLTGYEVLGFLQAPGAACPLLDPRAASLYRDYSAWFTGFVGRHPRLLGRGSCAGTHVP